MLHQNKVDPWGNIHAVKSRGVFLGNRGVLHNENQEIIATHRIKGWVTCLLEFKGRKREIMTPTSILSYSSLTRPQRSQQVTGHVLSVGERDIMSLRKNG